MASVDILMSARARQTTNPDNRHFTGAGGEADTGGKPAPFLADRALWKRTSGGAGVNQLATVSG
ncbi:hypothetical protein TUM17563_55990 [Klebsiella oxytoca]|nr:hypothetical protein TUM17563_55990 [Klebsiella oxytoca]